ncbi:MAG: hypothetical protein IJ104_00850 [Methanobrevibacter sp.]|nr:hypothetical protein [Methanobrevibacter sp.]MBQ9024918.1 hypothetical protein [Methanobrevibacter sp.]
MTQNLLELKQLEEQYMEGKLSKNQKRKLDNQWKQYLKENPTDYETIGLLEYNQWFWLDTPPSINERKLLKLIGEAKYNEDHNNFKKAVTLYDQANKLYFQLYSDELHQIELETGRKLAPQFTEQKLKRCKEFLFRQGTKELEEKAKSLEKTNPEKAIQIYGELNKRRPGMKKYDKRIEIIEKKLKK